MFKTTKVLRSSLATSSSKLKTEVVMKKPKIIFILSAFTVGGAEKQWAIYLKNRPQDFDVDIEIITIHPTTSGSAHVEQMFRELGVKITLVSHPDMSFPQFFWTLYRTIQRSKPTLVHTVLTGSVGTWGRLAAWLAGVPYIVQSDLTMMLEFTRSHKLLDPFLNRQTDIFLPNAHAIADRLVRSGVPREKIFVMPNITDGEKFNPRKVKSLRPEWGMPDNATIAGFIARFRPEKRIDLLLDAMLLVPENERPDYLVMGGEGQMMPMVKERVAADPWLREHVKLLGTVENTPGFFASVDYTLLTSDSEGIPNVVLEAMAMEKPVVATRVSDVPIVLEGAGFLADMGDAAGIAEGIRKVQAMTPEERNALGKKGRAKVLEKFELSKAAKAFWDVHKKVLKS
jgi:glycosyltransferase involved in cell wall biosynthesis